MNVCRPTVHMPPSRQGQFATRLTICLLAVCLAGCSDRTEPRAEVDTPVAAAAVEPASADPTSTQGPISAERMAQWTRSCALCHVRGEGGAPVLGDRDAWAGRTAQGEDVLLQHTVEGIGNMPPLGYCMDCEEPHFREIIRFMGGKS